MEQISKNKQTKVWKDIQKKVCGHLVSRINTPNEFHSKSEQQRSSQTLLLGVQIIIAAVRNTGLSVEDIEFHTCLIKQSLF